MIFFYNLAWIICFPLVVVFLIFRIIIGKEDALRLRERMGFSSVAKSKRRTIWMHAASVGESKIALNLSKLLHAQYPDHRILITTGTVTSAQMVRKNLSSTIVHQFIPLDNYFSMWLFFRNWKPKLGILIESELWPNLLHIGSKICPLILINARMSDKSFATWQKHKSIIKLMLKKFKYILCQSKIDQNKYRSLGADSALCTGNLKYSSNKLEVDPHNLKVLTTQIEGRVVWLAASTHPGDEEIIAEVHERLCKKYPKLLTIIAPRHVHRGLEIQSMLSDRDISSVLRSEKSIIDKTTSIYIADTMGELGLFFSVAKASFIGGSFKNGGHNPIEPAYFNTTILFGHDMSNFAEIAEEFLENKAAYQISNAHELEGKLNQILSEKTSIKAKKAEAIIQNHANVVVAYLDYIGQFLK